MSRVTGSGLLRISLFACQPHGVESNRHKDAGREHHRKSSRTKQGLAVRQVQIGEGETSDQKDRYGR